MGKKIREDSIHPQFDLLSAGTTPFHPGVWSYRELKARFWRLYQHDLPGAGIVLEGKSIELMPGFLYLIPPNTQFSSWCRGTLSQLSVHFEMKPIQGDRKIRKIPMDEEMNRLVKKIRELERSGTGVPRIRLYAVALASYALTKLPDEALEECDPGDLSISRLCGWINDLYQKPISVANLASSAGVGKRTLTRHFRTELGTTPYQFLLKQKYDCAEKLLRTTNRSLGEICCIIGVGDVFHFSRTFKSRFGLPPGLYRKKNRRK